MAEQLSVADVQGAGEVDRRVVESHVARYRFAAALAGGAAVLDAACGCGYGAPLLLDAGADSYLGVDVNAGVLAAAREMFTDPRASFACEDLFTWTPPRPFGLIVSFETIEHVPLAVATSLIDRFARALAPGGALVLSCPNRSTEPGRALQDPPWWPYHAFEWSGPEFFALLERWFGRVERLGQRAATGAATAEWHTPAPLDGLPAAETLLAVCREPRSGVPEASLTRGELAAARCLPFTGGTLHGRLTILARRSDVFSLRFFSDDASEVARIQTNMAAVAFMQEAGGPGRVQFADPVSAPDGVTLGYLTDHLYTIAARALWRQFVRPVVRAGWIRLGRPGRRWREGAPR